MTSWDGRETVRLTSGKDSESTPRWSPDGRFLAFLSSRRDENETSQLWLLPRGGGEAEKITELPGRRRGLRLGAGLQAPRARRVATRSPSESDKDSGDGKKKAEEADRHRPLPVQGRRRTATSDAGTTTSRSSIARPASSRS